MAPEPSLDRLALPNGEAPVWTCGEGEPLLYFHPAAGFRWSPGLAQLSGHYRLIAPLAPGFDGTPLAGEIHSLPELADWMAEVHDRLISRPCPVVGHSFGGWLAQWFAVRHPARVTTLVLSAPAGWLPNDAPPRGPNSPLPLFVHPQNLFPSHKPPGTEEANWAAVGHYTGGRRRDPELPQHLSRLTVPTLILRGSEDAVVPWRSVDELQRHIPGSMLLQLPDAGHGLDVDQPEAWAKWVSRFGRGF
ncbi:MAG: alpha/beta hydrolase [Firmicutes bacterium]|nr:alpha/beta hydrolase [Bacillota bacterium]